MDYYIAKHPDIQTDHYAFIHKISQGLSEDHKENSCNRTEHRPDGIGNLIPRELFPFIVGHDDNRHQHSSHIAESLYHTIQTGSRLRPLIDHTE